MTPCPNCDGTGHAKLYVIGKDYEDASLKGNIYCDKCVGDRAGKKVLGVKIRGTSK